MTEEIYLYRYEFSPYGTRMQMGLLIKGVPFVSVLQPEKVPRPDLALIGVNYRRIPVLVIGRDVYADTSLMLKTLENRFGSENSTPKGSEQFIEEITRFGMRSLFPTGVQLMPQEFLNEKFVQDRKTLWPWFDDEKFARNRPANLKKYREMLKQTEEKYIPKSEQQWILPGDQPTFADLNLGWTLKWTLYQCKVKNEEGCRKEDLPHLHRWLSRFCSWCKNKEKELEGRMSGEEAAAKIFKSADPKDPSFVHLQTVTHSQSDQAKVGAKVQMVATDVAKETHPQRGLLVGISEKETVIDIGKGLQMHFPPSFKVVPQSIDAKL